MSATSKKLEWTILGGLVTDFGSAFKICKKHKIDRQCFSSASTRWFWDTIVETGRETGQVTWESLDIKLFPTEANRSKDEEKTSDYVEITNYAPDVISSSYTHTVKVFINNVILNIEKLALMGYRHIDHTSTEEDVKEAHMHYKQQMEEYNRYRQEDYDMDEVVEEVLDYVDQSPEEVEQKCPMGFIHGFDGKFLPIKPYEYIVLGARPGAGKTSFLMAIANHCLRNNKRIFIGTIEMSVREIVELIAAQVAEVNINKLHSEYQTKVDNFKNAIKNLRDLYKKGVLGFSRKREVDGFMDDLTNFGLTHGKPDVVILDYLQLMQINQRKDYKDKENIDYASIQLKRYTDNHQIPVVAAAQLNRDHTKEGTSPELEDLKGSGNLEQDANRVWLLHTPKKNGLGQDQKENWLQEKQFYQAKGRGCPIAKEIIQFNGPQKRFFM